jgi:AcrR family transcriptional regulator
VSARPPFAVAARELLRDTILDAALDQLAERPWAEVTMAGIAQSAGVSRQTLYNEFGSRGELAQAFVLREADRLLAAPEAELTRLARDPRAAIGAALRSFLEGASANHLLQAMREEEDNGLLALVTTRGDVLEAATARLDAHVQRTWPGVDPAGARRLMDVVVRLGISHATLPSGTPAQTADDLVTVIGPQIDALFAALRRAA